MMTLEDYANDVGMSLEEVKALCDKVGIAYEDENTLLDDISITLLDNELQDQEDYVEGDIEDLEARRLEEEVEDRAEKLAFTTKIDLENEQSFTKVKQNKQSTKTEKETIIHNIQMPRYSKKRSGQKLRMSSSGKSVSSRRGRRRV